MEKNVKDLVISVVRNFNAEMLKSKGRHESLKGWFADNILESEFLDGFMKDNYESCKHDWVKKHSMAILSIPAFILDKEDDFQYDYVFKGLDEKNIDGFIWNIHWVITKWLFCQEDLVKTIAEKLRIEDRDELFPMTEENIEVIQNTLIEYVKERDNYPTIY